MIRETGMNLGSLERSQEGGLEGLPAQRPYRPEGYTDAAKRILLCQV
jgi:hypothetical protein